MELKDFIEKIKNSKQLSNQERNQLFIIAQLGENGQAQKAKQRLREHYLPLSLVYLEKYKEAVPYGLDASISDFELIEEGFIFMAHVLDEYINSTTNSFSTYFNRRLKIYIKELQKDYQLQNGFYVLSGLKVKNNDKLNYELDEQKNVMLYRALNTLSSFDKSIIKLRYGFDDNPPQCYKEISLSTGLSVQTVRAHHNSGIQKLRKKYSVEPKK